MDGVGTSAFFGGPRDLALDGAGNLYVVDVGTMSGLRKVVIATGAVTTVAGGARTNPGVDGAGAAATFGGPYGIALDGAGNAYVTDLQTVRKIVLATGVVTTLAGSSVVGTADGVGTAANFTQLQGVAFDGAGNLFVTDVYARNIRKIEIATRVVTTLAGSGGSSSEDGTGAGASFKAPFGIASDQGGNLYVVDDGTIRKIVIATGVVTTLAGSPAERASADGVGAAARFEGQGLVASDGAGDLFIADTGNSTIRKLEIATGTVTTVVGSAGDARLQLGDLPGRIIAPYGVAVGAAGELFIAELSENVLLVIR